MRYFSHDTNALSDELILQLRLEHGLEAVAVYWAILEYIYGEEKPLAFGKDHPATKALLYRLGISYELAENYLNFMLDLGLLLSRKYRDANYYLISSLRAEEAIEAYRNRAETARQNGKKGGRPKNQTGNPEKTQSVSSLEPRANQSEKLNKNKNKSIGFSSTKEKPNTSAVGASEENLAPSATETSRLINELDEQYARWHAEAVACPPELNPYGVTA